MAMLSEVDSPNFSPIRLAAITAGASWGDIEMALAMPTFSTCGTSRFVAAVKATQIRMIGTAKVRMNRGMPVRESEPWALMLLCPGRRPGRRGPRRSLR